jgi:ribosome-interacting GTPase 1
MTAIYVRCIGVIEYKDAKIQLLDLPGIIEGAAKGRGRGKQVIGVARTADMVLMMLEAEKADIQRELLTYVIRPASFGVHIILTPPLCYVIGIGICRYSN